MIKKIHIKLNKANDYEITGDIVARELLYYDIHDSFSIEISAPAKSLIVKINSSLGQSYKREASRIAENKFNLDLPPHLFNYSNTITLFIFADNGQKWVIGGFYITKLSDLNSSIMCIRYDEINKDVKNLIERCNNLEIKLNGLENKIKKMEEAITPPPIV